MDYILAKTLLDKKLITCDMEIEIEYDAISLGNLNTIKTTSCFMIQDIKENNNGEIIFLAANIKDGNRKVIQVSEIINIDGMNPLRFASVYGVTADGSSPVKKRRGRIPKRRQMLEDLKILKAKEQNLKDFD